MPTTPLQFNIFSIPLTRRKKIANMLYHEIQKRSFTKTLDKDQIAQAAFIFDHDTHFRISSNTDTPSYMEEKLCSLFRNAGHKVTTDRTKSKKPSKNQIWF